MTSPEPVSLREYMDLRFLTVETKIDNLGKIMRTELDLLAAERERERSNLCDRLEGMNGLRKQIDVQSGTFATRERVEMLERQTWRALGLLGGVVLLVQVLMSVILKGGS